MKNKYAILSLIMNTGCIIALQAVNHQLAEHYISADGKTKALFGIIELSYISKKLMALPLILLGVICLVMAFRKKEKKGWLIAGSVTGVLALAAFFIRSWVWMV